MLSLLFLLLSKAEAPFSLNFIHLYHNFNFTLAFLVKKGKIFLKKLSFGFPVLDTNGGEKINLRREKVDGKFVCPVTGSDGSKCGKQVKKLCKHIAKGHGPNGSFWYISPSGSVVEFYLMVKQFCFQPVKNTSTLGDIPKFLHYKWEVSVQYVINPTNIYISISEMFIKLRGNLPNLSCQPSNPVKALEMKNSMCALKHNTYRAD